MSSIRLCVSRAVPSARSRSSVSWPSGVMASVLARASLGSAQRPRSPAPRARRPAGSASKARCPRPPPGRRAAAVPTAPRWTARQAESESAQPAHACATVGTAGRWRRAAVSHRSRQTVSITLAPASDGLIVDSRAMHEDYAVQRGPRTLRMFPGSVAGGSSRKAETT